MCFYSPCACTALAGQVPVVVIGSDQPSTRVATAAGSAEEAISPAMDSVGDTPHLNMDEVLVLRLARAAPSPEDA